MTGIFWTGTCSTCGIRLADAEPGHRHDDDGGVWAVLKDLFPDGHAAGEEMGGASPARTGRNDNTTLAGMTDPAGSKER